VTTHSPEAYRYYLEGLDCSSRLYSAEAEKSFRKALEIDSTFAMAYLRLANLKLWQELDGEAKELMAKAVEYSDKVSQKERYYIKSLEAGLSGDYTQAIKELHRIAERYPDEKQAFLWLGVIRGLYLREPEEAVRSLTKAIEIDPLYKSAYNMLAYAYNDIGDFEKSIWAIDKYIYLAPDEANPYDTRADLYAFNGKLDQAIESYNKALEIKADFVGGLDKLGHMYLFKREYAKAKSCYQQLSSSTQDKFRRSGGRTYLALIPLYQGKFEKALEVLDDGIAADRMEQTQGWGSANKHFLKACVCKEKKELKLALREAEEGIGIWQKAYLDDTTEGQFCCVRFLGEENELAQADELAKALTLSEHNLVASLRNFRRAAQVTTYFCVHYLLARTHLDSGRLGDAVTEFERLLSYYGYDRLFWAIWDVKTRYYLGLAYEKSGWNKKAIEQYQEFLEIWKHADPGIPEVEDAKERLKKLRVQS